MSSRRIGESLASVLFASAATPMIQAASFLFKESEKTWNFCRVPKLVDVEDGPLWMPYIEGEI